MELSQGRFEHNCCIIIQRLFVYLSNDYIKQKLVYLDLISVSKTTFDISKA